jgi:hypothetical protein
MWRKPAAAGGVNSVRIEGCVKGISAVDLCTLLTSGDMKRAMAQSNPNLSGANCGASDLTIHAEAVLTLILDWRCLPSRFFKVA